MIVVWEELICVGEAHKCRRSLCIREEAVCGRSLCMIFVSVYEMSLYVWEEPICAAGV